MKQTLVLTASQEREFEKIISELCYALKKTFNEKDLINLSYNIFKESGKQTYNSKKEIAIDVASFISKNSKKGFAFLKDKVGKYETNGIKNELLNDLTETTKFIKNSPEKISKASNQLSEKATEFYNEFLVKSKNEKIEIISVSIMSILIFYASAGGEDFEGGIPDSDLNAGIGFHRHFLTHSILTGFFVEFLIRSGIGIINESYTNLPENHNPFWDKTHELINKHKGVAIGAMWAGISVHLLKDSGIFKYGDIKPYNGIPMDLTMETHKNLFLANSTASAIIAYKTSVVRK